uniref:Uncharacterized protein n=1 Tax=Anopheles coluzzii TaxID=1518534 RepID=A0A8W7P7P6_ANOCL
MKSGQTIGGECSTLLHRDHRCSMMNRVGKVYGRLVRSAFEQTRPLEDSLQLVCRLNDLTVRINSRYEAVHQEVDERDNQQKALSMQKIYVHLDSETKIGLRKHYIWC